MSEQARILIVDDEQDLLSEYARILESEGHSTIKAAAGNECLCLAREQHPDLILLDGELSGIDPIEVRRRIKFDFADRATVRRELFRITSSVKSMESHQS